MKTRIIQDDPGDATPSRQSPGTTRTSTAPTARQRSAFASWVGDNRLIAFFAIAYAISWCLLPFGTFLPVGPLVAALVVTSVADGTAGLRRLGARLIRWRVRWYLWVAAVAVPVGVQLLMIAANVGLGAAAPTFSQFSSWSAVLLVFAVRLIDPLNGPMGEEPGLRGFAQPTLQLSRCPLVATAILALLAMIWHSPLLFIDEFEFLPIELLTTVAVTFWYAWLFNHTGGSVLLTIVAHATEGTVQTSELWTASADSTRSVYLLTAIWSLVAVTLVVFDWRRWTTRPAPSAGREPDDS